MLGKSGSEIKYIPVSSGVRIASGSTNPSNLAGFEFATLVVMTGSIGGSTAWQVQRSGTSDGTFATYTSLVGISGSAASGKIITRSFTLDSSAVWYRVVIDQNGTERNDVSAMLVLQAPRLTPVDQHSDTTSYSDVLGG